MNTIFNKKFRPYLRKCTVMNSDYVEIFRSNDHGGIKMFYRDQWPKCSRLIQRMGGSEDQACDIMQSAMLALLTNVRTGRYEARMDASMGTYFLQICKYLWLDVRKSVHHRATKSIDESDHATLLDKSLNVEDLIEVRDRQKNVRAYMKLLDQRCRDILRAFYWDQESLSAIAKKFELTADSAKTTKYRCLQKLRQQLIGNKTSQI